MALSIDNLFILHQCIRNLGRLRVTSELMQEDASKSTVESTVEEPEVEIEIDSTDSSPVPRSAWLKHWKAWWGGWTSPAEGGDVQ